MNRYNQVPHLTQDTIWENDKNTRKHHIQESQVVSPFPAVDHKAARNRQDKQDTQITKRSYKTSTALERSVRKLLEDLSMFLGTNLTLNSDVDQDT